MASAKLNLALKHSREAEKALKTGIFKWSPDYDTAASEYTKAATNYKLASMPEKAKDAFIEAGRMQENLKALFHSAKLLTQAAALANELNETVEAVDLMHKACRLYREHGAPDTAALTLVKAGNMCETSLPDRAVELYTDAAELCESDEKFRDASDHLNKAVKVKLKQKKFIDACSLMERRIEIIKTLGSESMGYSIILGMVVVYLTLRDFVAANTAFQNGFQLSGFGESSEATYAEYFIQSFKEGDQDLLTTTKRQAVVTHLDVELARLAKALTIPKMSDASDKNAAPNEINELKPDNLTTDFDGVLC